eukprot:scaffold623_cov83-Cylindrotheca_fusiformis.AAC.1
MGERNDDMEVDNMGERNDEMEVDPEFFVYTSETRYSDIPKETLTHLRIDSSVIEIPERTFEGCFTLVHVQLAETVTRIGKNAFSRCYKLEIVQFISNTSLETDPFNPSLEAGTITFPERAILEIEDETFSYCYSLRKVIVCSTSTRLGKRVFMDCLGLISVELPEGLQVIGAEWFSSCKSLPAIKIPSSVTEIGHRAFFRCQALKHIQLPDTVTRIGNHAFGFCVTLAFVQFVSGGSLKTCPINPSLEAGTIVFPERAKLEIEDDAFCRCESLRKVIVCSINTRLGIGVFRCCTGLISVELPEGLQVIEECLFACCESLPAIKIPSFVTTIGSCAFIGCQALKNVQLPDTVTRIGKSAFCCCLELEFVQFVSGGSLKSSPINPSLEVGTIMFPERAMLEIEEEAFCRCKSLQKVIVCSTTTRLGKGVFKNCSGLISVHLPDGLEVIEVELFYCCESLPTIKIPSSVVNIGSCAFTGCNALKHVQLPETLASIGHRAFASCFRLEFVQFVPEGSQETYPISPSLEAGTIMFPERAILEIENDAFCRCESLRKVIVCSITTTLGSGGGVFSDCFGLRSVDLPEGLQVIVGGLFFGCRSLTTVKIPSSVIEIGHAAFSGCEALNSVQLPETLASIGRSAFEHCCKLEFVKFVPKGSRERYPISPSLEAGTITFPERAMLEIEKEAFYRCKSLRKVIVCSISTRLGRGVFKDCSGLIFVDLPEGLQVIEAELFSFCESLPTIKIPSSVIEIGDQAFDGCNSLSTIKIPSVVKIGFCAFIRCQALKHVQLPETLASIGSCAFNSCEKLEFVHFVPERGSQEIYQISPSLEAAGTVVFPDRAKLEIGDHAFDGCKSLRKVIVRSIKTRLGTRVFKDCSGLISVDLPEGLEVIEGGLFLGCRSLTTVKIPSSVIEIRKHAFDFCPCLTSLDLPHGLVVGERTPLTKRNDGLTEDQPWVYLLQQGNL